MSTTTPTSDTTTTPTTSDAPTFAEAWTTWHDDHEQDRASEHGFLAITSIRWLTATPERFDDAPGTWSTDEDGPVVALADDETIEVDGQPVTGTHRFGPLPERSSTNVVWHDGDETVVIEVARRGGSDLPCAYTPHATCPLPPAENRSDVGVEAGEQLPAA